jgi:ubiquinone biosynthesis protein
MTVLVLPLIFVFTALTVLVFAVGARRLLGLRFSFLRTLIAGVLAFLIASPIITAISGSVVAKRTSVLPELWFVILGVTIALVVGMVFLVVAEALVPSGSVPGPLYVLRGMHRRMGRVRRYWQISRILVRRGLMPYVRGGRRSELATPEGRARLARSVRLAMEDGGVTFVKLGQVLSTRRDLLPAEFISELSRLQDDAAEVPWPGIEQVLRSELGAEVGELFASFDREPLAAASIAQVHAATLPSGARVVVKVRRPDVSQIVDRDLDIAGRLAARLERSTSWGRAVGTAGLAAGFAGALREELDLRVEARNMTSVAAAPGSRGSDGIAIPVPYQPLCTGLVLVMERFDGRPLAAIDAGLPLTCAPRWPAACSTACSARSCWRGLSTPTRTRATSCCWPTAGSGCWTSGPSGASTKGCVPRCSGCCWPWTGATRPGWPTRSWRWSSDPRSWTSYAWNGCWAGSWPGTSQPGSPPT